MFYCPDECDNPTIKEALEFFLNNNHRQFRPLFLSVISAYKHQKISENVAEDVSAAQEAYYELQSQVEKCESDITLTIQLRSSFSEQDKKLQEEAAYFRQEAQKIDQQLQDKEQEQAEGGRQSGSLWTGALEDAAR